MASLSVFLDEEVEPRSASVELKGQTFEFYCEDPGVVAGELMTTDPAELDKRADHFTRTLGKKVRRNTIADIRVIMATWKGDNKPSELDLVKAFLRKPVEFVVLARAANSVIEFDATLYARYADSVSGKDAANPLIRSGLGNSEGGGGPTSDSPTSSPNEPESTPTPS